MNEVSFVISFQSKKKLIFTSEIGGLKIDDSEYTAGSDGVLIYDKTNGLTSDTVICQLSTNTSTLIPSLRILGIPYNPYFDDRDVVESQNDITFFWKKSRLSAFYNRFSTDGVLNSKREEILRKAIDFIILTANKGENFLPEEKLSRLNEECRLLGFYHGFPIFDANFGLPQLLSRIGIHVGTESILISTPLDKYSSDVEGIAHFIEDSTGEKGVRKKNRIRFDKKETILSSLGI